MLALSFIPETNEFTAAADEYKTIWQADGQKIVTAIEHAASFTFKAQSLPVLVHECPSQSHPLTLRASYSSDSKKATLVHELLHVISADYMLLLPIQGEPLSLGLHKQIYLLLYDVWVQLYGASFADEQVTIESARSPLYREAWDWALALTAVQRKQLFSRLIATAG